MKNKLKILLAASEITPLAKVGGLGDVTGALPKALNDLGADIRLIMPFYGLIDGEKYKTEKIFSGLKIQFNGRPEKINLYQTFLPQSRIPVYLLGHKFFSDKLIYGRALADGPDDLEKFSLFSQAILPSLKTLNFRPNIIHLNDWHTAETAGLIKKQNLNFKTVYTIHNLAMQGISKNPNRNLMAEGILNADAITTVSPAYAKEILTPEYGAGLEKILKQNRKKLFGILNGLDTDFFDPSDDRLIKHNYSASSLGEKIKNKTALQAELGWPENEKIALVGLVTRFVGQKGVDLITENFSKLNCQFVFLGTGEKKYEDWLLALAKKYPNKFNVQIKFDEKLAHEIYAASDIFLVPSKFEPCGLTQMIAMRYGAVPVVRATGGLKDTVDKNVGFVFKKLDTNELYETLEHALGVYYYKPAEWRRLQLNGIKKDFTWKKSAKEYIKLCKKIIN